MKKISIKKRIYPPKRVTLITLLVRAVCVVVLLSLAFAYVCDTYLRYTIHQQVNEQISAQTNLMQRYIKTVQEEIDSRYHMQEISAYMAHLYYDIMIEDRLTLDPFDPNEGLVQIVAPYSPGCYIAGALVDKDNNIAASNRQILLTHIWFMEGDDPDAGWYVCDDKMLHIPEVDQLYSEFRELSQRDGVYRYLEIQMTSAYVNRETHTFIPHEGTITVYPNVTADSPLVMISEESERIVREIHITFDKEGYELMEMHQGANSEYPHNLGLQFYGVEQEIFDQFDDFRFQDKDSYSGGGKGDRDGAIYDWNVPLYVDGEPYFLCIRFAVNYNVPQVRRLFWKWTLLFTAVLTLIALLWCWRKNVLNKAKYAFEDYQRDLTDHLAHDIKTPLMAISGYAENIQKGSLSDAEQQQYLSSILDNVAFTDSLISRTLFLNHIGEKNALKFENIQLENLVEDTIQKYELLFDEKNITYRSSGSAALHAERTSLETIIENLISNAVKYTPENGSINVTLDQKYLMITNTVTEKMNTKELKHPFVRGDEARSNVKGNGLGLSIADRAAHTNGFTLSLSCTDAEFKAELKF